MTRVGNRVTRGRLLPLALLQVLVLRRGKVGGGEGAHLTRAAVVAVAI